MSGMTTTDAGNDYKGRIFKGKVVAIGDPLKMQRIKAVVPGLWDTYDEALLPWILPIGFSGGGRERMQWVPAPGAEVYVQLQDGDSMFPVYTGGRGGNSWATGALSVNYPHRVGFELDSFVANSKGDNRKVTGAGQTEAPLGLRGHHFYIDRSDHSAEYKHPTGTKINIATDGSVSITVPEGFGGSFNVSAPTIRLHSSSDTHITTGGKLYLN